MDPRIWLDEHLKDTAPWKVATGSATLALTTAALYALYSTGDVRGTLERLAFKALKAVPGAQGVIDKEMNEMKGKMEASLFENRAADELQFRRIPEHGLEAEQLFAELQKLREREEGNWKSGKVSGGVYHGMEDHLQVVNRAYQMFSLMNPLHPDVFPSGVKFESEIVAMSIDLLGGQHDVHCGNVTSGGTESILMAMKAYRDYARKHHPNIRVPEIVAPVTAHAAFDKAAGYFGMRLVKVPLAADYRVDMSAVRRAITSNTVVLVGSAPGYPHGIVDPIEELAALAQSRGLGMHVDACLGGFLLPWLQRVGHPGLPNWNLSVPGVTSMSADTHKYGYAVKGTSVVLFSKPELRQCMYFVYPEWVGGIYASPTISGSRAGGLLAACWASMISLGQDGYLKAAKTISDATVLLKAEVAKIPQLELIGDSHTMVIAFRASPAITSQDKNFIFKVMEGMKRLGWSLNPVQKPNGLHVCVTLPVAQHVEELLQDLRDVAAQVEAKPEDFNDGVAPIYGTAFALPDQTLVGDLTSHFLDLLTKAKPLEEAQ
eukprot:CAMPEP_0177660194 /NCGR_PEP_ID=MMETSP0447-20121125/17889_1 /TAXON_ID=0 /ORGANISM="Stygamoeba regulata, Strain BSH-02190019" /LENGTH=545 /DNA_ID=CAMNT_0019165201 /DNA_START=37 /DNA_END=1674 /DNA_ORIENTATION=+